MKRITILVCFFSIILADKLWAQTDTLWNWQSDGGSNLYDQFTAIRQLTDGSLIAAGSINIIENGTLGDGVLTKFSSDGQLLWQHSYPVPNTQTFSSMCVTHDGGFIITGRDERISTDAWVVRTNSVGDTLWTRHYHHFAAGVNYLNSVVETTNHGFFFGGSSGINCYDSYGSWALRVDSTGNILWDIVLGGNALYEGCNSVTVDPQDNLLMGCFIGDPTTDESWLKVYNLSQNGTTRWSREIHPTSIYSSWPASIEVLPDQSLMIGATCTPITLMPRQALRLVKIDTSGTVFFDRLYNATMFDNYCGSAQRTFDGGYVLFGHSARAVDTQTISRDMYIVRTDSLGDTQWTSTFGALVNEEIGTCGLQTLDGNYVIGGSTAANYIVQTDLLLLKVGNTNHSAVLQVSPNPIEFGEIPVSNVVSIPITYSLQGDSSIAIDSVTISTPFHINGQYPMTITSLSLVVDSLVFAPDVPGQYSDTLTVYSTASNSVVRIPVSGTATASGIHSQTEAALANQFVIGNTYPNPFNHSTTILVTVPLNRTAVLSVYDITGRLVEQKYVYGNGQAAHIAWKPESLAAGEYFLALEAGGKLQSTGKLLYLK